MANGDLLQSQGPRSYPHTLTLRLRDYLDQAKSLQERKHYLLRDGWRWNHVSTQTELSYIQQILDMRELIAMAMNRLEELEKP